MDFISHRGNLECSNSNRENTVPYIQEALDAGFMCKIDICDSDSDYLYTGHNRPVDKIKLNASWTGLDGIEDANLILHIHNPLVIEYIQNLCVEYFIHKNDDFTITTYRTIWTNNFDIAHRNNGILMVDFYYFYYNFNGRNFLGSAICSDYIAKIKKQYSGVKTDDNDNRQIRNNALL